MARLTTTSLVPATPEQVFDFIIDTSRWPEFPGHGPVPGIAKAEAEDGLPLKLGSRVRVENTDGSIHYEMIGVFDRPARIRLDMEVTPPASKVMKGIEEDVRITAVEGGAEVTRTFTLTPRSILTAPMIWLVAKLFLKKAVRKHNRIVADHFSNR